jgi:hypothetical protein
MLTNVSPIINNSKRERGRDTVARWQKVLPKSSNLADKK